jgi:hypothetical protein
MFWERNKIRIIWRSKILSEYGALNFSLIKNRASIPRLDYLHTYFVLPEFSGTVTLLGNFINYNKKKL